LTPYKEDSGMIKACMAICVRISISLSDERHADGRWPSWVVLSSREYRCDCQKCLVS